MPIATSVIDTTQFQRGSDDPRKDKSYCPQRVILPPEVLSIVRASLPFDKRKQGSDGGLPTETAIYWQLIEIGLNHVRSEHRQNGGVIDFTQKELAIPDTTEYPIWMPIELKENAVSLLGEYNAQLERQMLRKLAGIGPLLCALVRRGLMNAPIKNIITDYS